MKRWIVLLGFCIASLSVGAQPANNKVELVKRLLDLQQTGIESMARALAQQPAMVLMQRTGGALQQLPKEQREPIAQAIQKDLEHYMKQTVPILSAEAERLAPGTMGALLESEFTDDELKQLIAIIESPVNRKFLALAPRLQATLADKVVEVSNAKVTPYIVELQNAVQSRFKAASTAAAGGGGTSGKPATN